MVQMRMKPEIITVDQRTNLVRLAVDIGKGMRRSLDFTDSSIDAVESILSEIHDDYARTKDEEGLRGIALEFAAYVIEVIERNHGAGEWFRNHEEFGTETFPFNWKGVTIFPYAWCLKRIVDGKQEDVSAKYKALVLDKIR